MNCPHCDSSSHSTARYCSSCGTRLDPTVSPTTIHPEPRILAEIAARTHNAVILTDAAGRIEWVNQAFVQMTGYMLDEVRGRTPGSFLQGPLSDAKICSKMRQAVREGREFHAEILNYHKSGRTFWVQIEGKPIHDEAGHLTHFMAIETDITEQFQAKLELERRVLERTLALENTVEEFEREFVERQRVEAALTTSEARLKEAHRIAGLGAWEFDFATQQLWWSEEQYRLNGVEPDFPITQPFFLSRVHPEDRAQFTDGFQTLLSAGIVETKYRFVKPDGTVRHMHGIATLIRDAAGQPLRMHGTNQDITERVQAKAALQAERDRLRQIIDSQFGFVAVLTLEGNIVEVNQTPLKLIELSREEVLGRKFWEVGWLEPGTEDQLRAAIEVAASGGVVRSDIVTRFAGVGRRDIDACFHPLFDANGQITSVIAFGVDITERKQAEAALRESEERFSLAMEATLDGLWDWNIKTGDVYYSPQWLRLLGFARGEVPARREFFLTIVHPEDSPHLLECLEAHFAGRASIKQLELRLKTKSGEYRWFLDRGKVVARDEAGQPLRMVGAITDITERKQIEHSLRLTQFSIDRAMDSVFWISPNAEILYVNDAACHTLGYSREELVGKTVPDIDPNFPAEAWPAHWEELKQRKSFSFESDHYSKDGKLIHTEVTVNYILFEGREYNCAMMRDITYRKQVEMELRESEERARLLMDSIPAYISYVDSEERYMWVNHMYEEWFRIPRREILGKTVRELQGDTDYRQMEPHIRAVQSGRFEHYEYARHDFNETPRVFSTHYVPHQNDHGENQGFFVLVFDVTNERAALYSLRESEERYRKLFETCSDAIFLFDATGRILAANPAAACMHGYTEAELLALNVRDLDDDASSQLVQDRFQRLLAGETLQFEVFHQRKDGTSFPVEVLATRLMLGNKMCILAFDRDITERKHSEKQAQELRDSLAHANRLGVMGEMAAGLAHELNQPLTSLCLYANSALAFDLSSGGQSLRDCLQRIDALALRTGEIVRRMRSFVSRGSSQRMQHNINVLIQDVLMILENEFKASVTAINIEFEKNLPMLMVDGIQIQQVAVNLIRNALEALADMERSKRLITIRTESTAGGVQVSISDTAGGIDPVIAASLFQPFQTTKPAGLGLGLAICHTIIETHGGEIGARSNPGRGTTFFFILPSDSQLGGS